ncbi:MAG: hypothetical protein CMIDDMOC_00387 [Sodalis sp. Fle]|nr:MAG: hypothetical protein CMIDDMOC_00387 [Sodalis sp. Fle]
MYGHTVGNTDNVSLSAVKSFSGLSSSNNGHLSFSIAISSPLLLVPPIARIHWATPLLDQIISPVWTRMS